VPPPLLAHRELSLAAVDDAAVHAQHHVRPEAEAAHPARPNLLDHLGVVDRRRDAQLAADTVPRGQTLADVATVVVLPEERSAAELLRLDLRGAHVGVAEPVRASRAGVGHAFDAHVRSRGWWGGGKGGSSPGKRRLARQ
jgi:hypothetical protein